MELHARRLLATGASTALLAFGVTAGPAPVASADERPFDANRCVDYEPNDPAPAWQVDRLGLEDDALTATGAGVTIAVLDTGIDNASNPALEGVVVNSLDFAAQTDEVDCQHGTQVASLIAGQPAADGSTSFRGVAPNADIIAMRVLTSASPQEDSPQGEPLTPTIDAIHRAIDMDVDIISISQQGTHSSAYAQAITDALDAGIVVVAASGNQGSDGPVQYPAAYPGVIAVGMADRNDVADERSQSNKELEVTVGAPGVDVLVANPSGGTQSWEPVTGTSFAAPLVTGTVALMLEDDPSLSPEDVQQRLEETADPPAGAVPDPQLGYGIVNPARSLSDLPPLAPAPARTTAPPQVAPHPLKRPKPDHLARNLSVGLAVVGVVTVALGTGAHQLHRARRR